MKNTISLPTFTETLGTGFAAGDQIEIIHDGNFFEEDGGDEAGISIAKMNNEMAGFVGSEDEVVFEPAEPPKTDIPFQKFLQQQRELKH